jgi:hypothetical protein
LVARKPVYFIVCPLLVCALCGAGFIRWNEVTSPEKLWVPQDSDFVKDSNWVKDTFVIATRFQTVLFTSKRAGENVVTPETLISVRKF